MTLTLGFSPCPNDTFIFDALVHQRIDTEGLDFKVAMLDVSQLNQRAFAGELDVTKLSYHAYGHLTAHYALLRAGSALGRNCGPLLLAKSKLTDAELLGGPVAIPGKYTTANFLLSIAYPELRDKQAMLFDEIEAAVLKGQVTTGLIIHENRFTYAEKGLLKLRDLGEFWEETTGFPIPLGGIMVNRKLPLAVQQKVDRVVARSVAYAFAHPEASADYVKTHAQAMDPVVMQAHIELYVNDFSRDLGVEGLGAIAELYRRGYQVGITPAVATDKLLVPLQV
ncbi:MAG: 1,4-dihydroxy-6-naphthoate synthase [Bacteroidota bacterium]